MLTPPTRRDVLWATAGSGLSPHGVAPVPLIVVSPPRTIICGDIRSPCAVGWGGVRLDKREGDGATPSGRYPLRRLLFRLDRLASPETGLPVAPINPRDGWCTDPSDPDYNRQVGLPRRGRYEDLWRRDGLYDIVVVIGYNDAPTVPGKGSAIFLHVARPSISATDGCIAIPLRVMRRVVERCDINTFLEIQS